ncbi:gastrula zinc finger protein XlCGF26.1-like [Periplaneta americana]|uniref:gastrula zinc finger protein XlCGF26.1-like n=1 Tax=Periplaneta americana TaxID=6978 RepID=UPI0037E78CE3
MSTNFESICRLCMSHTSSLLPLFSENGNLPSRIMVLVPVIKLCAGDGLPAQVCQQCVHQVNNSYNFKLQCETSDFTLRQYLNNKELEAQPYWIPPNVDTANNCVKTEIIHQQTVSCDGNILAQGKETSNKRRKFSSHMKDVDISDQEICGLKDADKFDTETIASDLNEEQQDDLWASRSSKAIQNEAESTVTPVQESLPCNICGKRFVRKSKLNEHVARHVGGRPHVCEVCGKRFTERSSLKKHAMFHTGQKAHVCDVCGKRFILLAHLKTHTLIHTGQKSHVCDVCGKRFSQLGNFRTHALLHTGEKPFSCNLCGKSFAQKNTLKIHIAAHTGQKPYVCNICGRSFTQRAHLKTHTIVHSGQKQFCCLVCGTSFTRKHNLKKHAARHSVH